MTKLNQMSENGKTHWKKMYNPDYLGAYSLEPGEDLIVTITGVTTDMVPNADGRQEECVILQLKDQKPLVLNKTNAKTIQKVLDSPYVEDWVGQSIQLYAAKVKAFGDVVEALRVRPVKPQVAKRKLNEEQFSRMLSAISAGSLTKEDALRNYSLTQAQAETLRTTTVETTKA